MKNFILPITMLLSVVAFSQTVVQDTTATQNQQINAVQNILNGTASKGITVGDMRK